MSKKYLLYIHFQEFDQEPHKSFLINSLLADYYGKSWGVKKMIKDNVSKKPKKLTDKKVMKIIEKIEDIPDLLPDVYTNKNVYTKTCKVHGVPLDSRGKCLQKRCKYS